MLVRFPCSATATSPRLPPQSSATRRRTWRSCARRSARTRCLSPSSPETLSAHIILRGAFGQTNDRGDNFDKTDVARPFRIFIEAGAANILIDPFLSDNPSWHKGWIGSRAGEDSTRGGGR